MTFDIVCVFELKIQFDTEILMSCNLHNVWNVDENVNKSFLGQEILRKLAKYSRLKRKIYVTILSSALLCIYPVSHIKCIHTFVRISNTTSISIKWRELTYRPNLFENWSNVSKILWRMFHFEKNPQFRKNSLVFCEKNFEERVYDHDILWKLNWSHRIEDEKGIIMPFSVYIWRYITFSAWIK